MNNNINNPKVYIKAKNIADEFKTALKNAI